MIHPKYPDLGQTPRYWLATDSFFPLGVIRPYTFLIS
jgi:hypothetical protein